MLALSAPCLNALKHALGLFVGGERFCPFGSSGGWEMLLYLSGRARKRPMEINHGIRGTDNGCAGIRQLNGLYIAGEKAETKKPTHLIPKTRI